MKKFLRKARRGMSLIETLVALVIFSLAIIVMARVTSIKIAEQSNIDSQYIMINVDGFMADLYHTFHRCNGVTVTDYGGGSCSLSFDLGAEGSMIVEYIYDASTLTGTVYQNGVVQFKAAGFEVRSAANNLYVAVKISGERKLDMDIYR